MIGEAHGTLLPDGRRLHLHHGPIDIIAEAFGEADEVQAAYAQAAARFATVLAPLVEELAMLRAPIAAPKPRAQGPIARRMVAAVWPHRAVFVTPMAAVAGAVADEVLDAMVHGRRLARAYVNNGGDIAIHLDAGESLAAGVVHDQDRPALDARVVIDAASPVRGLATSGWRGRSFSLGIADAVTVLAESAAMADAAATLIANAVNADHPAIERRPANTLRDDTDLGARLVTVAVGPLPRTTIEAALVSGVTAAEALRARGLIHGAYLALQGESRVLAPLTSVQSSSPGEHPAKPGDPEQRTHTSFGALDAPVKPGHDEMGAGESRVVDRSSTSLTRHSPATPRVDRGIHRAASSRRDGSPGPRPGWAGSRPEDDEKESVARCHPIVAPTTHPSSEDLPA